ncbi:DUF4255 domain-containing protein [Ancylobacter oerskovii]|uniref:DUF4255 domain-containing protein n=1 Tax=Ancylobacter oerskovii TaxID=459519 RepID=A0ABW4Z104_9HYPH|nr:DUF4255 domain-containing protein [Ancylobacter oerskovii]MBS7542764.1 DUF4255 domain-containing protein [Ancylobacter oerskovii]
MSNGLAIAAVTRVLQDMLHSGLVASGIGGAVGGTISVSAMPPDRILGDGTGTEATQLNLFLHQIAPNAGWTGRDLPSRDARAERLVDPMLALDLHYLLTAYAAEEFQGEILLGHAMQLLHETPVLSRDYIRDVLANPPGGGMAAVALQALVQSDLAEQLELIKIRPRSLGTDDMSKLWTAFQSHYRTSTAYEVSVVLIQRRHPKRTPLPVLSRGPADPVTGRDAGVTVQASPVPSLPTLTGIVPPRQQTAARLGETIRLEGHHLSGEQVSVRFAVEPDGTALTLPGMLAGDGAITVTLPPANPPPPPPPLPAERDPANWPVGVYRVTALLRDAGGEWQATNVLPLLLAPLLLAVTAVRAADVVTFTVTCGPPIRRTSTVFLIVGSRELPAEPIAMPQATTLTFRGTGFTAGQTLPVRLRVDGIDSLLIDRTARPPAFDPSQQVMLP